LLLTNKQPPTIPFLSHKQLYTRLDRYRSSQLRPTVAAPVQTCEVPPLAATTIANHRHEPVNINVNYWILSRFLKLGVHYS